MVALQSALSTQHSVRESYADMIPKDPVANMDQRMEYYAMTDPQDRSDLWCMCSRDILFWINAFVWTFDPRLVDSGQDQWVRSSPTSFRMRFC